MTKLVLQPGSRGGKARRTKKGNVTYHPGAVSAPYCALEGCKNAASGGVLCEMHRQRRKYEGGPGREGLDAEQQRRVYEREKWKPTGGGPGRR